MTSREKMAVSVAPLFLRMALSVTFIWTGLGKLMSEMPVSGEPAAVLANMGVSVVQAKARAADVPAATPPSPVLQHPTVKPEPKAEAAPKPTPAKETSKEKKDAPKEAKPSGPPALVHVLALQSTSVSAGTYTAADFPQPVNVSGLYGIALLIHDSARTTTADGKPVSFPLVPAALADGMKPKWIAWAATLTELIGGLLILFGLFTRLAALGIASTMAIAIWLTQVGPAIQAGNATLGFLPNHAAFDIQAWQPLPWQFALLCAALSLFFAGSGGLSMDRIIRGRPVVNKPKPAPVPK